MDGQWGPLVWYTDLSSEMTHLGEMWVEVGGRSMMEGINVYTQPIHFAVHQKLTQHFSALYASRTKKKIEK